MIAFSVFLARLITKCATREPFTYIDHTVGQNPQPSRASDLTPELVAEWEAKLQDPDALTAGQRYGLECKIAKLEASISDHKTPEVVKGVARKQLEEASAQLESYKEPVPVEPSTLPKYQGRYTDYSGHTLEELEQMWQAHLLRIRNGHMVVAKTLHNYKVRGQLIEAGVWDWKAPLFQCAPKGSIKRYYAALRDIKRECKSIEFEIARQERLQGRETPDNITMWNTSGVCGPAGGEDTRRFPVLKGNLGWADILDMVKCKMPDPEVVAQRLEELRWHNRVNGENFTTPPQVEVPVAF